MKANKTYIAAAAVLVLLLTTDCGKKTEITICGNRCSSATPWRVESLDLGLPCFATKQQCIEWAAANGYGDKPCVLCN